MLFAVAMLACARPSPAPGAVVIVSDTTRADYGGSGLMPLPTHRCRVYTRAHSAASYTTTSSIVLQTGRLPVGSERLRPDAVRCDSPDAVDWPADGWTEDVVTDQPIVRCMLDRATETDEQRGRDWEAHSMGSPEATAEALGIIGEGRPGNLLAHLAGPHQPYTGGLPKAHASGKGPRRSTMDAELTRLNNGEPPEDPEATVALRWAYREGVEHTMANVARLAHETGPDRLFIFTSDHGEALGEDGLWGHGKSLHDPQIHVPLVVCGPGVVPGEDSTPVGPLCVAETVTGRGPCDLRTGEGLRAGTAGMLVEGEWVTRDVGAEWAAVADGSPG